MSTDPPPRRTAFRVAPKTCVGLVLLVGAALMWGLFELQRLPYNPPHDMSTLLGGPEINTVRILIGLIAIPWSVGVICFVRMFRPQKP